jgi:putative ABC transport system permease protein
MTHRSGPSWPVLAELRYAVRVLRRAPLYTVTIVGVLALAMALGTTVFAVVDGVLFKPLPYARAGELYDVSGGYSVRPEYTPAQRQFAAINTPGRAVSLRDLEDWRRAWPEVELAAYQSLPSTHPVGDLRAWSPSVAVVDEHVLDVLGVAPLFGGFTADDFVAPVATPPALLSYAAWIQLFGGRADVIGQRVTDAASRNAYRVAGVLPRDFVLPSGQRADLVAPLVATAADRANRALRQYRAVARVPAGVSASDVARRLSVLAAAARSELPTNPRLNMGVGAWDTVALRPVTALMGRAERPLFAPVFGLAMLLVLLGCTNVSGVMAGRAADRLADFRLRRMLGATTRHLAIAWLAECIVPVAAAMVLGLCAARVLLGAVVHLLPASVALLKPPVVDVRVAGFTIMVSAAAAMAIAAWPLVRTVRVEGLPAGRAVFATTVTRSRARLGVIAAQIALGVLLTTGGALLVASLVRVWLTDPGFRAEDLFAADTVMTGPTPAARRDALEAMLARVRAVPGVRAVAATDAEVMRGSTPGGMFAGSSYHVTAGFLDAIGGRLEAGRWFTDDELATGAPVVVVSESLARAYFPDGSALGRELAPGPPGHPMATDRFAIIGIVADEYLDAWDQSRTNQQAFLPSSSDAGPNWTIIIRTDGHPANLLTRVLAAADGLSGAVTVTAFAAAGDLLADTVRLRRFQAWLFGGFGVAALVIVGAGVLGLIAMATARRTREIGIRMALGSTRRRVVAMLLREQIAAVVVGLAFGGLGAVWAVGVVKTYLYRITAYDPVVWAAATGLVLFVAAIGAWVPAFRASRVDPAVALRVD